MENFYFSKPWLIWIHYLQIHARNYNTLKFLYYAGRHQKDDGNIKSFVFRHKINMVVSRTSILKRWIAYLLIRPCGYRRTVVCIAIFKVPGTAGAVQSTICRFWVVANSWPWLPSACARLCTISPVSPRTPSSIN